MSGIDPQLPITLLPVRIETRFAGPATAPRLQVRLYPDDVHIDRHDPRLTSTELSAGQRYWSSLRAGTDAAQAWAQLINDVSAPRASWVREALTPTNASGVPTFPQPETVQGNAGVAATARALPAYFIVRVRCAGVAQTVQGSPIPASLQVGVSFGTAPTDAAPPASPSPPAPSAPPAPGNDPTLVLDEALRWMVDFDAAVAVGMAVTIDLPANTQVVDDVVAIGMPSATTDGAALVSALIEAHRFSDGAAFIPPGTPTNNLADSPSGYSASNVPAPEPVVPPPPGSDASALASAWGLDPIALSPVNGAGGVALDEARQMGRALFEATWGSYLRLQAQPGFELGLLPQAFAHVTSFVRGGGPLPVIRFGRQPYAIAPVMARGAWAPMTANAFEQWLANFLPGIRPLWTSGSANSPTGPELFAFQPVSTRVRLRSANVSAAVTYMTAVKGAVVSGNPDASRQAIQAEIGITKVTPSVFTQLYPKDRAELWLPMAADHDAEFDILSPSPAQANSVLGLLLRNAALKIVANASHEFAGLNAGQATAAVARTAPSATVSNLSAAAGNATATIPGFTTQPSDPSQQVLASTTGKDADGNTFTIKDRLSDMVAQPLKFAPNDTRYFDSDALAAFRDALPAIAGISTSRRAVLTGEILDCASHRYDAWMTSLATSRLSAMRSARPLGNQLGAWGCVRAVQRRQLDPVAASPTVPEGTVTDPQGGGFVMAPSPRQASAAGVLRAAWRAHGGVSSGALGPFAVGLTSTAVRRALTLAEGMRNGQQLGALLGYLLERGIHDASGVNGIEIDWVVYELRSQYPLQVDTIASAGQASAQRLVADGWKLAQLEIKTPGAVVAAVPAPTGANPLTFGAAEKAALQAVIDDVVAALDALSDLGLSESMYQLAGSNLERAAAATDMFGRAAVPPDVFESAATPRGGRGIEQRLIAVFGAGSRPPGYASDTPRARLAPGADAFVARRLGDLSGIHVRLLDAQGREIAAPSLASLSLSALDIAALDLSTENITLSSDDSPATFPGVPSPNPGRQGMARLLVAAGQANAVTVGFDLTTDAALLDLLDHAAAWQHTLAGRTPLSADSFVVRSALVGPSDASGGASSVASMVVSLSQELGVASPAALKAWGIGNLDDAAARLSAAARVSAAAAIADPVKAAGILLGGPAVVEGTLPALPADVLTCLADQPSVLGQRRGVLERWLQDSARVRPAAQSLNDALLRGDLAGAAAVASSAVQTPAAPYASDVDPVLARSWVGMPFPGALGDATVTSAVLVGDSVSGALSGIELDAWTEVVPDASGTGAVTANLAAPSARAPNVILLAVQPDVSKPWTSDALLSVVDEALELAQCRLVDLDATQRVPALLPAIYLDEYNDSDLDIHHLLNTANQFPARWVARGSP
jgi:hypothetical protein